MHEFLPPNYFETISDQLFKIYLSLFWTVFLASHFNQRLPSFAFQFWWQRKMNSDS